MTYNTALRWITSIGYSFDGNVKYFYDLSNIHKCKLTTIDSASVERHIIFKLRKDVKKKISVKFICDDFRIDFPLIKDVKRFEFGINDFTMMLSYGIKSDTILPNVEF